MNDEARDKSMQRSALADILGRIRDLEVWIVGDIMLDEYVVGTVDRVSPEAPVPIVRVCNVEYRLGGAANVARQVAALGAHTSLAGVLGQDTHGGQILTLCEEAGLDTRAVLQLADRHSTRKVRVLGQNRQMLRLDWEDIVPCPAAATDSMIGRLNEGRPPDIIILSDYAKGVLTKHTIDSILARARSSGIRIVVDPKRRDFSEYRGASVITPNLGELQTATGQVFDPDNFDSIAQAARTLAETAGVGAIVVTLGDRGMAVASVSGPQLAIPVAARRPVSDTTGAGDTVVATLASCLAAGATLEEAAHVANAAAAVSVSRVGTVAVEPRMIREILTGESEQKMFCQEDLAAKANDWRAAGRRIVFTNGCFDLLHAGHLSLLHDSAKCGDILVVAINSDASVRRLKGYGRPIVPEGERAALLAALACVDAVAIFDENTPLEILCAIRPDVLVKGQDYRLEEVVGRDLVEGYGGRVTLIPLLPEKSTTALLDRIVSARRSSIRSG
jgi:D-beta-D-heptose 7-phosphate kinase / D-beta-D-heptose 1-phosphate adenosyltransferase